MTPLEAIARIATEHAAPELALRVRSLAAREESRIDGFWEELADASLWQGDGSLAELARAGLPEAAELERELARVAEDLRLRGFASMASDAWLAGHRKASRRDREA